MQFGRVHVQVEESEHHRVEGVLGDGGEDAVLLIAQQQAHHRVDALAGAICQEQAVGVTRIPIPLLYALPTPLVSV